MKIRYLPEEDRKTLHILRHTSDLTQVTEILEEVLQRPYTVQALWEYRKWFYMLTPEVLREKPILAGGLVQIHILSGKLKKAREVLDAMPEDTWYYFSAKLTFPGIEMEERQRDFQRMLEKGYAPVPNLMITAGRPSILNGVWDLTPYTEVIWSDKEKALEQITALYGEQAESIYDVAYAESLYYQDKCYEALVAVVSLMPQLKEKEDMRLLFVALTLEIFVMVQNGQASSTVPMMDSLRKQIKEVGIEEYLPNIDALDAWCAMYDGDYTRIAKWMREAAPDEYAKFCMLDLFRYMVKMRVYIIQGKYLAVTSLATRLLPLLEEGKRYMDLCELHMIWAMSDYADGRKQEAFGHLEVALELAEKNHYDRLLADEGKRMFELLKAYRTEKTKNPYLAWLTELSEKTTAFYPRYLKSQLPEKPALTNAEMRILRLLQDNYTNAQIAEELGIAVETAKKHCKNILAKLEVKNRHQAVHRAIEYGMIEETKRGPIPII